MFPSGDQAIYYFGPEFQFGGNPNVISIEPTREVRVDLRVSSAVRDEFFESPVFVQVAHLHHGGYSSQVSRRVRAAGVSVFEGPFEGALMASVMAVAGDDQVMWAAREVTLASGEESTSVILNVTDVPLRLSVLEGGRGVGAGANVVIYAVPDRTGWIAAWSTDESGSLVVPRVAEGSFALSCYVDDELRAIDHRINLSGSESLIELNLDDCVESDFRVEFPGDVLPGSWLLVQGAVSRGLEGAALPLDSSGESSPLRITGDSAAIVTPRIGGDLWVVRPEAPVLPGLNEFEVLSTGILRTRKEKSLGSVAAVGAGRTVAQWIREGRTECVEEEGRFSVRVPVGPYVVERAVGESVQVLVETGKVTTIP